MNTRQWTLAFTLWLTLGAWANGQTPAPTKPEDRIDGLVRKLGSASFVQREQARKELEAIGAPALEPLRRANKTGDAETTRRIGELIRQFEEQILTKQILTPKQVHLKVNAATVQQAIADLGNLSGYPLQFLGDATQFADKKITLDTGKTSFWQALDQLCDQAGLMERIDVTPPAPQPMPMLGGKGGMRRIRFPQPPPPVQAGPITLIQRGKQKSLVSYAGAVKTELRISRESATNEWNLMFVISVEPSLLNNSVIGTPVIEKALDEKSRKLQTGVPKVDAKKVDERERQMAQFADPLIHTGIEQPHRRVTQIRVKDGAQVAKQLKELAGKLTLEVDLQNETLAKVEKVLEATGKSAQGANGGTLKVLSIKKQVNGDIEVQVSVENMNANPFGGNVIINGGNVIIRGNVNIQGMIIGPNGVRINGNGGGSRDGLPDLLDVKGQKYKVANINAESMNFVNGLSSRSATIVYQANPGQTEPRDLVLFGTRTHTIAVPFRFENLPLP